MKKEDRSLIDVNKCRNYLFRQVCFLRCIGLLFGSFVSSISVLLLTHSVQPSYLVCSLLYPVDVIRLNIATTSARRLKFVL